MKCVVVLVVAMGMMMEAECLLNLLGGGTTQATSGGSLSLSGGANAQVSSDALLNGVIQLVNNIQQSGQSVTRNTVSAALNLQGDLLDMVFNLVDINGSGDLDLQEALNLDVLLNLRAILGVDLDQLLNLQGLELTNIVQNLLGNNGLLGNLLDVGNLLGNGGILGNLCGVLGRR